MQSRNGGWGAFDTDNDSEFLNRIPFADMEAMIDPPTEDLTGRLLEMMGTYGHDLRFSRAAAGARVPPAHAARRRLVVGPLGRQLHLRHLVGAGGTARHRRGPARAARAPRGAHGSRRTRTTTAAGARPSPRTTTSAWPAAACRRHRRRPGRSSACSPARTASATRGRRGARLPGRRAQRRDGQWDEQRSPAPASRATSTCATTCTGTTSRSWRSAACGGAWERATADRTRRPLDRARRDATSTKRVLRRRPLTAPVPAAPTAAHDEASTARRAVVTAGASPRRTTRTSPSARGCCRADCADQSPRSTPSPALPTTSPTRANGRRPSVWPISAAWEQQLDACFAGRAVDPHVRRAGRHRAVTSSMPIEPFRRLLQAFRRDVHFQPFATFEDLRDYCRCSADPVGHLVLALFGYRDAERRRAGRRNLHRPAAGELLAGRRRRCGERTHLHPARGSAALRLHAGGRVGAARRPARCASCCGSRSSARATC